MMVSIYYQDQNAVSGLYCQVIFSNSLFIPMRENKFEWGNILSKHSGPDAKIITPLPYLFE